MAQIKDIIEVERQRETREQWLTIHLFREGSFFRAYEWSAWLCVLYVSDKLKVSHKQSRKEGFSFCFVGFPVTSMEKYTPLGAAVTMIDDRRVEIRLEEGAMEAEASAETLSEAFLQWKEQQPFAAASSEVVVERPRDAGTWVSQGSVPHQPMRITDVMQMILAFPIESRSPMQAMQFLSEVKERLARMV